MQKDTYYSRNREKVLAYQKEYYISNREILLEKSKNNYKDKVPQYKKERPEIYLLKSARNSARQRGHEFSITKEDIVIPEKCPLLGIPLTYNTGKGREDSTMSVDRIDSTKGYIPGNIWIISLLANRMKQNATKVELINFSKNILSLFGTE